LAYRDTLKERLKAERQGPRVRRDPDIEVSLCCSWCFVSFSDWC